MTPEEEQMMRAAVMRSLQQGGGMPSGMTPGMATPSAPNADAALAARDFKAQDRRNSQQMAYANQLRGQKAPQGRNVGPLNVYQGPNWGESLAHGVSQGLGGYMAGRARRESENLDVARQETAAAGAREDARKLREARDFITGERVAGQDFTGGQAGLTRAAKVLSDEVSMGFQTDERIAAEEATAAAAKIKLGFDKGKGTTKTYVGPDGPLTVIEDTQGVSWKTDAEGNIDTPVDVSGLKELTEIRNVALSKAEMEELSARSDGADNATFGITMASDIFRADNQIWNDATGLGGESVFTGMTGFASPTEAGPEVQEFQRKVQKLGFEGMSADFDRLNLGQIAKNEFEAVSKANANWKTEPYGLVMLQAGKIPLYEKAFQKGIDAKSHTNAQRKVHMQKMEDDVIFGATQINQRTGKPTVSLKELERKGINVVARRAELADKVVNKTATKDDMDLLRAIIMARKAEAND